jgi:hypothetical protein
MDYGRLGARLAPDVFERLRRHRGIAYRVRYAGVAKEVLQPSRIHASVGQGIPGRMADHVDVNRKRQFGGATGSLDHVMPIPRRSAADRSQRGEAAGAVAECIERGKYDGGRPLSFQPMASDFRKKTPRHAGVRRQRELNPPITSSFWRFAP